MPIPAAVRFIAAERGAFDPPEPQAEPPEERRYPLVDLLSEKSLAAIAALVVRLAQK